MNIAGISCAVPKTIARPEDAYERIGRDDVCKIVNNSSVQTRRIVTSDVTASDLCVDATKPLLEQLGWERDSIDLLVFVTQTPDYILPATAYSIHDRLGLADRCLTFDVNLGCSGFTHGLMLIRSLLQSGVGQRALLLCGDTISKIAGLNDRGTCLLFGDAGTATAIELDDRKPDQFRAASWGSEGSGYSSLIVPGGAFRDPWKPEFLQEEEAEDGNRRHRTDLKMDGAKIFQFTIRRVPPMVREVLEKANWTAEKVDAFVFHQANKFIIDYLRRKLKVPEEKVPTCLEEFGNTSSASIPLTLITRMAEQLAQPQKLVFVGFGVGLSWSAIAMETRDIITLPLIEV